jgi:hypothetical protein
LIIGWFNSPLAVELVTTLLKVLAQANPNRIHLSIAEILLGEADKKGLNEVVSDYYQKRHNNIIIPL